VLHVRGTGAKKYCIMRFAAAIALLVTVVIVIVQGLGLSGRPLDPPNWMIYVLTIPPGSWMTLMSNAGSF
jgi:hypothetical protein